MPMSLEEAVFEYQMVGGVPAEEGSAPQVDVIVVAARRETVTTLLQPVRAAGLEPVGIDLSAFAMIRALAAAGPVDGAEQPAPAVDGAVLFCSIGDVTNLAFARGRSCLFTRVSHAGLESIAGRLEATRGLTPEHAGQWMTHVGLDAPLETVTGDPETVAETRESLEEGVTALLDELRLSLDYYAAQEAALPVERVVLCGPGSAIPGLTERMETGFKLPISVARPAALEGLDEPSAARLTLPLGLALEE
jgi:type IV pilus assembly protein PilM